MVVISYYWTGILVSCLDSL